MTKVCRYSFWLLPFLHLIFTGHLSAQNWEWQNPEPTGNFLWGIEESEPGVWWTGGEMGGLFTSGDDGISWQQVFFSSGNRNINDIEFISAGTGFIAAGFGGLGNSTSIIFRTTDGGITWTEIAELPYDLKRIKFLNPDRGFILGGGGLMMKTTDGGATWAEITPAGGIALDFHFTSEMKGVAVGDAGYIARTTDGGVNWITLTDVPYEAYLAVDFTTEQTGYISGWLGKVFRTTNGGSSWSTFETGQFYNLVAIDFANRDTGYAVGDYGVIFRTTNAGASWIQDNSADPTISEYHYKVKASSRGTVLAVGAFGLINRRSVSSWSFVNRYFRPNVTSIFFISETKGFAVDSEGGIYSTNNSGGFWERYQVPFAEQTFYEEIIFNTPQTGYIFGPADTMLVTTNGGDSWIKITTPEGTFGFRSAHFPSMNTGYAVGYSGSVIKTTNGGASWFKVPSGILNNIDDVHFLTDNLGFAGSYYDGLLKTTNGGVSWTPVPGISTTITAITFVSSLVGYASGGVSGTYKTTDGGVTWFATTSTPPLGADDIKFKDENTGYIGTSHIYITTNGGESWEPDATGFGTLDLGITGFAFTPSGDLYASGLRGSIIKLRSSPSLAAPLLISPSNNAINQSLSPLMRWGTVAGGSAYEIQIARTSDFRAPVFTATGITQDTTRPGAGTLQPGREYFWRVRVKSATQTGAWSSPFGFTTAFAVFSLRSVSDTTFAGDTLTISYISENPSEAPVTSLRIRFTGFGSFMQFYEYDTTGTLAGSAGWNFSALIYPDSMVIYGSGAPIVSGGELFRVRYIISNVLQGNYPYNVGEFLIYEGGFLPSADIAPVVIFPVRLGDVDLNGLVQAYDAGELLKFLAGMRTLNRVAKKNANVTTDNQITALDASVILRYVVGLITTLPHSETTIGSGHPGPSNPSSGNGEISVPFTINNGANILSLETSAYYDTSALRFRRIEWSTAAGGALKNYSAGAGVIKAAFAFTESKNFTRSQELFKFIFEPVEGYTGRTELQYRDYRINENLFIENAGSVIINGTTSAGKHIEMIPGEYLLDQNYPNPFNPETIIRFGLPEAANVKLDLYDLSGALISTIYQGEKQAGYHTFRLSASGLSSGIYFYRLTANDKIFIKKMNIIK